MSGTLISIKLNNGRWPKYVGGSCVYLNNLNILMFIFWYYYCIHWINARIMNHLFILIVAPCIPSNYLISMPTDAHT